MEAILLRVICVSGWIMHRHPARKRTHLPRTGRVRREVGHPFRRRRTVPAVAADVSAETSRAIAWKFPQVILFCRMVCDFEPLRYSRPRPGECSVIDGLDEGDAAGDVSGSQPRNRCLLPVHSWPGATARAL